MTSNNHTNTYSLFLSALHISHSIRRTIYTTTYSQCKYSPGLTEHPLAIHIRMIVSRDSRDHIPLYSCPWFTTLVSMNVSNAIYVYVSNKTPFRCIQYLAKLLNPHTRYVRCLSLSYYYPVMVS